MRHRKVDFVTAFQTRGQVIDHDELVTDLDQDLPDLVQLLPPLTRRELGLRRPSRESSEPLLGSRCVWSRM